MSSLYKKTGMHQGAKAKLFRHARELRERQTKAEELLWEQLRKSQLDGFKFRRQHPIGKYIVDFYCHKKKLAIELDGGYHDASEQKLKDQKRTAHLSAMEIKEIRFKNEEILEDIEKILDDVREHIEKG